MVFGVVTRDGDIMPPFIFHHNLTLNMDALIKHLEKEVLSWIKRLAAGRSYLPNPSIRAGYDTRSISKRSLTGLNSEFSFS